MLIVDHCNCFIFAVGTYLLQVYAAHGSYFDVSIIVFKNALAGGGFKWKNSSGPRPSPSRHCHYHGEFSKQPLPCLKSATTCLTDSNEFSVSYLKPLRSTCVQTDIVKHQVIHSCYTNGVQFWDTQVCHETYLYRF